MLTYQRTIAGKAVRTESTTVAEVLNDVEHRKD